MSVFIGKTLSTVLDELEQKVPDQKMTPDEKTELKLEVIGKIPEILLDNTDRNRTSPFAFTGNRFEFRAVGSSGSCASPMIVLNTIVAQQLMKFKDEVEKVIATGIKKDEAIIQCLRKVIVESKKIRFEGNGYSQEWIDEAARRGLPNISDPLVAFKTFLHDSSVKLLSGNGILTKRELEARHEIHNEIYVKKVQIEARVLGDLAINHIIPTAIAYQNTLINNVKGLKELYPSDWEKLARHQYALIREISEHIHTISHQVNEMIERRKEANQVEDVIEKAHSYNQHVKPFIESIRTHIDKLEMIVDDEMWPLPKYREMLFIK